MGAKRAETIRRRDAAITKARAVLEGGEAIALGFMALGFRALGCMALGFMALGFIAADPIAAGSIVAMARRIRMGEVAMAKIPRL